jgi:hypothetical protein
VGVDARRHGRNGEAGGHARVVRARLTQELPVRSAKQDAADAALAKMRAGAA